MEVCLEARCTGQLVVLPKMSMGVSVRCRNLFVWRRKDGVRTGSRTAFSVRGCTMLPESVKGEELGVT